MSENPTSYRVNPDEERDCPFCQMPEDRICDKWGYWISVLDAFPVTDGHTLIISRRHVRYLRELHEQEAEELMQAVRQVQESLSAQYRVKDFNVGLNDGAAAGQTVPHIHVHVIPRRKGDVEDPRGGIRHVIPSKARYWEDG